jgi:hypothetical protein
LVCELTSGRWGLLAAVLFVSSLTATFAHCEPRGEARAERRGEARGGTQGEVRFASRQAAFVQGYSAFKSQQYDIAVPALEFAAERGVMRAKFFLAKIYSDNGGRWTDHARAYALLREIITNYSDVDPRDPRVAPFVSRALTSLARYERDGLPDIGLKPSTQRALVFFNHAAEYFDDADAQFELAKHYLAGDGVETRVPFALNWLAKLSKRGHAGAQAFLANLYWDGRYTLRDPVRALALVTVAVENASEEDRFWIEDLHQNIFCEADAATRAEVRRVVDGWRRRFGRPEQVGYGARTGRGDGLGTLAGETQRTCANGDVVGVLKKQSDAAVSADARTRSPSEGGMMATGVHGTRGDEASEGEHMMQGSAFGLIGRPSR